jgi:MFS family permease
MLDAASSEGPAPWPSAARAWWAVGMFCLTAVLSYSDRQVLSLLVDPLRADLHLTDVDVGLLQGAAFSLIYAVAGLALGHAADVLSRKFVILAGIVIWSVATFTCGYATSFAQLFAARAAVGIGEAALAPAAISMLTDSFPSERRGAAIGTFLMGMIIGSGAAIAIGGLVIQAAQAGLFRGIPVLGALAPWRTVLVCLGLLGVPVMALVATVREPERRHRALAGSAARSLPLREVLAHLRALRTFLMPLYIAMGLSNICDYSLLSWTPALLSRRFGLGAGEIGTELGTVVVFAGVLGAAGAGIVADRLVRLGIEKARLKLAYFTLIIGAIGTLVTAAPTAPLIFSCVGVWILASTSAQAAGLTILQEMVPNEIRGLSVSISSLVNIGLGLALGAALPAAVGVYILHDPQAVGLAMTLVALPAAIVSILLYRRAMTSIDEVVTA